MSRVFKELYTPEESVAPGFSTCPGCAMPIIYRHAINVLGKNTVSVHAAGCAAAMATVTRVSATSSLFENAASFAAGIKIGLTKKGRDMNVLAFIGDGGTVDIGLQALSGAAERGDPIIYICYDNEAYMNTGIQRSSSTTMGAWTSTTPVGRVKRGKGRPPKDVPLIMADHRVAYVATASVAYLQDFARKVKKAAEVTQKGEGMAYLHVNSPCPTGWGFPTEKVVEVARLAVQTGMWPLYEVDHGVFRITQAVKERKPVAEYLRVQRRFRHLAEEEIKKVQSYVDANCLRIEGLQGQTK